MRGGARIAGGISAAPTRDWSSASKALGVNAKISTLRQLEPLIRHPLVMISDADVQVPADFAGQPRRRLWPIRKSVWSTVFIGWPIPSAAAMRWEAVAINADFWTQVLQARSLKKVDFALGAVMALPAAQLQAIGGFAALADYLADDYQLGRHVARQGKRIVFAPVVADCHDPPRNWAQVWAHQVRWARTIRVCQPAPFFFSILNNATSGRCSSCSPRAGRRPWPCARPAVLFRVATAAQQQSRLTQSRRPPACWGWPPVKDMLEVAVWAAAFCRRSNRLARRPLPHPPRWQARQGSLSLLTRISHTSKRRVRARGLQARNVASVGRVPSRGALLRVSVGV